MHGFKKKYSLKFHTKFWTHTCTPHNMRLTVFYFCAWVMIDLNCDVISLSDTGTRDNESHRSNPCTITCVSIEMFLRSLAPVLMVLACCVWTSVWLGILVAMVDMIYMVMISCDICTTAEMKNKRCRSNNTQAIVFTYTHILSIFKHHFFCINIEIIIMASL